MVRSRSRSPRWKRRSLSPVFRAQEYNRQRHYHIDYDSEYKIFPKDSKKLISWRMEEAKHGQTNPRYIPHETNYHRLHESRSYSPSLKRNPSEHIDNHKSFRTYSPERNESIRRNQFTSRYLEMSHKEHHQSFYPSKVHVREVHEDTRAVGNTKEMKTYHRPLKTLCKFERKWNENDLRQHQLQEDKYVQSSRRFSNECMPRSSSQKRYPDRDYREYGPSSKKVNEMERYDRESASSSKWKQNHSSNQKKEEQRNLEDQWRAELKYSNNYETKVTYEYSHKHHRYPDGGKYSSDEKEKYVKLDNEKYSYCKGVWNSKYSGHYSSDRASRMGEPHAEVAMKYNSGKGHSSCAKFLDQNEKEQVKKDVDFRGRIDFSSSYQHDIQHKISDVHARKEKLTVKVDMKKTMHKYRAASGHITERQTSCDLVAVGKKPQSFHPVFEHIKSVTQKVEQNPSKEFAQEIITIIHQVKANYFKSSDLTLNERFSKIQDISGANEVKRYLDPEIHRRIDMSLAELQNKRAISGESGQNVVRVLEDPNDLRHDIERRRKQRLENEDEDIFYINIPQRHAQDSSFVKLQNAQTYKYQKSPRFPSQPFRKFIRKPYTCSFIDGRPHFRSNLVQKGLYIQAKYQRLRYAGARGVTTYKIREELLRKQQVNELFWVKV
ncbi:BCLAF1 and THRAP3 family member 3 isoform X3 [Protobothrops mucrosquamatus]|uniref:BCLAF1 and THRAP3 family member 3 isoform X3 n=1 Tax=Protobothrops mucrosquamatus TaxID=103944 RepID=UPI000775CD71|nr:BCLAF1 and THRAP3 family member 3 isoform X3 [Protobothrops mucrosquamatus]